MPKPITRKTGRYADSFIVPSLADIRAARDYVHQHGMAHAPEGSDPVMTPLNRLLYALESGKYVLLPQTHQGEIDRLVTRLSALEAEVALLKGESRPV